MQSHAGFTSFCSSRALLSRCSSAARLMHGQGGGVGVGGLIYVQSRIDYDTAFLPEGTMVRPFVWQQKSGRSLLARCLHRLMTGCRSDRGQARWDRALQASLFTPRWWLRLNKRKGGVMVRDEANDDLKPHRCFEGHALWCGATFYFIILEMCERWVARVVLCCVTTRKMEISS